MGSSIGYEGNENVKFTSPNLTLHIGNETILWNKVMKEVQKGRYAGPFTEIPFENYIQSPIGLVPKDNGKAVRLIFHLSYPRHPKNGQKLSVNAKTLCELCTVNYCDFDSAVKLCLQVGVSCGMAKSDFSAAFRQLCVKLRDLEISGNESEMPVGWQDILFCR